MSWMNPSWTAASSGDQRTLDPATGFGLTIAHQNTKYKIEKIQFANEQQYQTLELAATFSSTQSHTKGKSYHKYEYQFAYDDDADAAADDDDGLYDNGGDDYEDDYDEGSN